ncbi:zinc-binding alcohol dehydrogenase family protein [Arthrobacter sp. Sa2CUA1]|uniref:Zinc-binding alcohol dehydrogenase family protein n=1 Tax=Arthrobacter gallicola TaxID=2762225 RepID=A0ABR8UR14_9MICC|nr:zinc-binding alcohol dehydrogenase family protein [Arthrobacter gallicola]MBD7995007.1 zinc-binding alcohol dehydrogenase family protein [Arthrobacter gallicola]
METINAALIEAFGEAPRYRTLAAPQAGGHHELVDVLAVGLHPVTRSIASGQHYASPGALPFVPGMDGVVRRPDGSLAYVGGPGSATLAERTLIDPDDAVPLPADIDPAVAAATMNPAMSSWIALHARVPFAPGQDVLVLGSTGTAGSMAVKVARHLGAGRVVAAGRSRERLEQNLADGADDIVVLSPNTDATAAALAETAANVDVALDYLWGKPAELAVRAIVTARTDHARLLDWVHIGAAAGSTATIDGAALRSNALRISGSGFGSIDMRRANLPGLAAAIASGAVAIRPRIASLRDITAAWGHRDEPGERTVIQP